MLKLKHLLAGICLSYCSLAGAQKAAKVCECWALFSLVNSPGGEDNLGILIPLASNGDPATKVGKEQLANLIERAKTHPGAYINVKAAPFAGRDAALNELVARSSQRLVSQGVAQTKMLGKMPSQRALPARTQ